MAGLIAQGPLLVLALKYFDVLCCCL